MTKEILIDMGFGMEIFLFILAGFMLNYNFWAYFLLAILGIIIVVFVGKLIEINIIEKIKEKRKNGKHSN